MISGIWESKITTILSQNQRKFLPTERKFTILVRNSVKANPVETRAVRTTADNRTKVDSSDQESAMINKIGMIFIKKRNQFLINVNLVLLLCRWLRCICEVMCLPCVYCMCLLISYIHLQFYSWVPKTSWLWLVTRELRFQRQAAIEFWTGSNIKI